MFSDWRLLSDEIGVIDLDDLRVTALGRPILKGHSLAMIPRSLWITRCLGPEGMVIDPPNPIAHLKPTQASSAISGIAFPSARSCSLVVTMMQTCVGTGEPRQTFALLSQYGINYRTVGRKAFDAGVRLVQQCPAYRLHYRDAAEAEKMLRESPSLPCATTGEPHVPDRVHAARRIPLQ